MHWEGKQLRILESEARELDVEGALRSGKTTVCLWKEFYHALRSTGINILIARWTDEGTYGLLRPLWDGICEAKKVQPVWNSRESCYDFDNGSRVYMRGLMASKDTMRYSKFRGLTLARVYVDQAEEMLEDVYLELAGRLSQPGYPHQITISPQSVDEGHWINKAFPAEGIADEHREYISLSTHDNAHNLDPGYIQHLERLYPTDHPKHRTLVLGLRGMNVTGEPVYKGAFERSIHERDVEYDPKLPLEVGLDFGKHHPCAVFRQVSNLGQVRIVGGIMGQDMYLSDFIGAVTGAAAKWFPGAAVKWCGDPAGSADTSQGTRGAGEILRDEHGIRVKFTKHANSPGTRLGIIERLSGLMRKRLADGKEAFVVSRSTRRWLRVSRRGAVSHRFLADALQSGYVWDDHMISVANKHVRRPKKDGWYEHGCNCLEYLAVTFDLSFREEETAPLEEPRFMQERLWGEEAGWMNA